MARAYRTELVNMIPNFDDLATLETSRRNPAPHSPPSTMPPLPPNASVRRQRGLDHSDDIDAATAADDDDDDVSAHGSSDRFERGRRVMGRATRAARRIAEDARSAMPNVFNTTAEIHFNGRRENINTDGNPDESLYHFISPVYFTFSYDVALDYS